MFGLAVGFYHLTGILVIIMLQNLTILFFFNSHFFKRFMISNLGLTYFYANNFLAVDEEKYEVQELYTEGLMNSFGSFLVKFVLFYGKFIYFNSWSGF